jgi:hypothetical protein
MYNKPFRFPVFVSFLLLTGFLLALQSCNQNNSADKKNGASAGPDILRKRNFTKKNLQNLGLDSLPTDENGDPVGFNRVDSANLPKLLSLKDSFKIEIGEAWYYSVQKSNGDYLARTFLVANDEIDPCLYWVNYDKDGKIIDHKLLSASITDGGVWFHCRSSLANDSTLNYTEVKVTDPDFPHDGGPSTEITDSTNLVFALQPDGHFKKIKEDSHHGQQT